MKRNSGSSVDTTYIFSFWNIGKVESDAGGVDEPDGEEQTRYKRGKEGIRGARMEVKIGSSGH